MATTNPTNHVFVDFENVHEIDLAVIADTAVAFTLLLGAKQKQLRVELVEELLRHASSVQLIRLQSSGKNALDFTLAYYVGRAVAADPAGSFHIVSKDKGFDPLIDHLRSRQISAQRHDDFSQLGLGRGATIVPTIVEAPPVAKMPVRRAVGRRMASSRDRLMELIVHLENYGSNRPSSKLKLVRDVVNFFAKENLSEAEAKSLINQLRQRQLIAIDGKGVVTYSIPSRISDTSSPMDKASSSEGATQV